MQLDSSTARTHQHQLISSSAQLVGHDKSQLSSREGVMADWDAKSLAGLADIAGSGFDTMAVSCFFACTARAWMFFFSFPKGLLHNESNPSLTSTLATASSH